MINDLKLIGSVVPEVIPMLQQRYKVLQGLYWLQPIGRRALSEALSLTERTLRTETEQLKRLDFISISKTGMRLTDKGEDIYNQLASLMDQVLGMQQIESKLAKYLGIARCISVSGDSDRQSQVISRLGKVLYHTLDEQLPNGENIIAVMGGTTMAQAAEQFENLETEHRHNLFVPARGGIGELMNVQANTISAVMAMKTNGAYRAIYVPEQLSVNTYESLLQEPSIAEVLSLIQGANCVIHSIGRALPMAVRRKMTEDEILMLKQNGAVAESFGYFFNQDGQIVYKTPRIGLKLSQLQNVPYMFAIAGGKSKAKAIAAYMKNAPKQTCLITDEAVASEILKGVTL